MTFDASLTKGDLVTVTVTANGETHTIHGLYGTARRQAIVVGDRYSYLLGPSDGDEAKASGTELEDWIGVSSATGNAIPSPPGSRNFYGGSTDRDVPIPTVSSDWSFSFYNATFRMDAHSVQIGHITDEGRKWIEANLSTDSRISILEEKLSAINPKLTEELNDVLYRVRQDARNDERRDMTYDG